MSYKTVEDKQYAQYVSGYVWAAAKSHPDTYPYGLGDGKLEQEVPIALAVSDFHNKVKLRSKFEFLLESERLLGEEK